MAITSNPNDKYAFLFTGPTNSPRFIKDIENVYETLTKYYNYPPANIRVVCGSTDATPNVPGVTVTTITSVTDLETELANFAAIASGTDKTALLYFTGGGCSDASGSKLVIDGGLDCATAATVDPSWLQTRLNALSGCHVNVVMQQSYSGGFVTALTGSSLTQWSFTHACGAAQNSYGNDIDGSIFTRAWIRGLRLEPLPSGTSDAGKYADELGSAAESTNRRISLEEAMGFGKQIHDTDGFGAFSTPGYIGAGGPQYLGLPEFLIRDGSPWYESPDIYLTHPNHIYLDTDPHNKDLYIPDPVTATAPYNNTINIDVRNVGTHPVRVYSLGVELVKFGAGVTNDLRTACDIVPSGGIFFPMDLADIGTTTDKKDTWQWNTPFYQPAVHQCVRAEAELLCSDVDFTWSVSANDYEGQRNIDEMTIVPPPPPPLPFPNLQGFKEHIYGIQNRFDVPRKFILVFPEKYQEFKDVIELKWFEVPEGPQSEPIPLDVIDKPVPHIPFILKAGEKKDILLHAKMKPDFAIEDGIKLPFDILVEGEWPNDARAATHAVQPPNYASIAGFTVTIKKGSSTLKGTVLDRENRPVAEAKVFLRTVNDLQGAGITTDKEGHYTFLDINPDVYYIYAETENWRSKQQTIVLLSGKVEEVQLNLTKEVPVVGKRVKVMLDKIRIMNDHDPCIKGKGELTFTSVIVPDNDDSRKQVTRLPARGVYHVSGKPGENEIRLEVTLFDGIVKNRSLCISISGKEIDFFDPDDELNRYHRVFSGDPDTWYGQYYPSDEYLDREDVGDWALWYRIVRG